MIGRLSADDRPISRPISYLNKNFSSADVSADCRPIVGRSSPDSKVLKSTENINSSAVAFENEFQHLNDRITSLSDQNKQSEQSSTSSEFL